MKNLTLSIILLVLVAVIGGQDLMDQVFGEALLKSLSPSLREKLEEIHSTGVLSNKSESQMARIVKKQLTPEEIKEMETAYKKLILPMLQNTLEKRLGRKYEHLGDVPIEFEDEEDTEGEEVDDFKTESEELAERKAREWKAKEKNEERKDSSRTVNIENSGDASDNKEFVVTRNGSKKVDGATNASTRETDRRKGKNKDKKKDEL